jgi:hypothetical protein
MLKMTEKRAIKKANKVLTNSQLLNLMQEKEIHNGLKKVKERKGFVEITYFDGLTYCFAK